MLTLRVRLILVFIVVLFASGLFTWFGVRPSYEQALLDERITLITEFQQQRVGLAEARIEQWLRVANELKVLLLREPLQLESVAQAYIKLIPELKAVRITEASSGEFIQINASGATDLPPYTDVLPLAFDFRTDEAFKGVWSEEDRFLILTELSIGRQPYRLMLLFDGAPLRAELLLNVLGEGSVSEIAPADSVTATMVETVERDGKPWLAVVSSVGVAPIKHVVYSDMALVTAPVRALFLQTLLLLLVVFAVLGLTAWIVTDILRKPLDRFLQDVRPFAELEFDTPFRETSLPELRSLTGQMEQIRLTLKRYQRINVEQIITQEQRNRMLMTHASVLVGHFDETGTWLFRNEAMTAMLDHVSPKQELSTVNALLESKSVTLNDDSTTTAVRDEVRIENRHFDLELLTPDELLFTLRGHMLETYASDGSHLGGFLLLNDITQDREIDRMRTEMIHIIVHELQNPVAAVRGFLEILREEELTQEELTEIYALCSRSVETLRNLIDRFLDITRLESGKLQIDMEPVVLTQMFKDVIDSFKPQLKDKQLTITLNDAHVPVILGSQSMLEDVARNLISNAIKYGNPNRTIDVELGMDGSYVVFSVTDHGFGIPEEHRDKMFQKFYRIKAYNRQKGNGLGLAYVKEVVLKHNGTITFESNPEIGTRFIVRLPQEMGE
jgi:signal transduction histidine kinase